ncbi:Gfo/Idh/MocA family protein [Halalkalibacter hemicellulosilyticus]|uniref:Small molecule metabolism n=1 Tax=Halalkalibacter hemicellulosilyticusJCM 9152 TaxID=1236971 RepID=W4QG18_9BACI|nr:Gfo/Idh/MocA family oxidoreductase [Halalkalibacter hemicellulosilyticus]GAE30593.1 small molecule metabolism [Halalkalibacter hemicellulosilyticusJCM 9152]
MKSFRIILVGCGAMSHIWVDYVQNKKDATIVALVDINEDSARKVAERFKLDVPFFYSVAEAASKTNANLVFNTTIPEVHKEVTLEAFRHHCDVICEKPMATSLDAAKQLVSAAKEYNRFYAIMQNRRYSYSIRSLREQLTKGIIGDQQSIHADFFLAPHFGGFRDAMESPLIIDMAIHTFDQARFISGADAVSVYCHEYNPKGSWYSGAANAYCIFEMSNGSVFTYNGSWCAEGAPTSWDGSWRMIGTKGTVIWDGSDELYYETILPNQGQTFLHEYESRPIEVNKSGNDGHHRSLDDMFLALENGEKAETDCEDNVESMKMVFAAIESAKTGKRVKIK